MRWFALVAILMGVSAYSQDSAEPAQPDDEAIEETEDHGDLLQESEDADPEETATLGEALSDSDSEEREEAEDEDSPSGATMKRFRPTEKISEDRSVAFPNDI